MAESVFKVAAACPRVREVLEAKGWEFQGEDDEMDLFTDKETGRRLYVEDISEDFPVTFLMGELGLAEFREIAHRLAPGVELLEVESSWEGRPTTIVVAMTPSQVKGMFGRRTRMRPLPAAYAASRM